jgi:flagellar hook assembly protein FlgD
MISYATSVSGRVTLKAYDATGRLVETLVNTVQPAGVKTVNWDTGNIANGVYFLKLEAQGATATHKMILVK